MTSPLPDKEQRRWLECSDCGLSETRSGVILGEVVQGRDQNAPRLAIVGEAPGRAEDSEGALFVGPSGDDLRQHYIDLNAVSQILLTNVCACCPPVVRPPSADEALSCSGRLVRELETFSPDLVALVGKTASTAWNEVLAANPDFGKVAIVNVLHPSYVLRQGYPSEASIRLANEQGAKIETALKTADDIDYGPGIVRGGWLMRQGVRVEPLLFDVSTGEMQPLQAETK